MTARSGRWHGKTRYFGLHYDLHAGKGDTELGVRAGPKYLVPLLEIIDPDFVQTDCKGHPGYTSWYSEVPNASVSPGVKRDALRGMPRVLRQRRVIQRARSVPTSELRRMMVGGRRSLGLGSDPD